MKDIPVSDAPTTTIREFFTILGSLNSLLVVKQRANGLSFSSWGSLSWPSTGICCCWSAYPVTSGLYLSWSHFLSKKWGNLLDLTCTNSWNMVGITVLSWISKYRQVLAESLISSLRMKRVHRSKIGFITEKISLVWAFLSCSFKSIAS